jgi:hypothetical protein
MTDTLPTVKDLLADEKLLRLEIAKVLGLGSWAHTWMPSESLQWQRWECDKPGCDAVYEFDPTDDKPDWDIQAYLTQRFKDCKIPDLSTDPLEVLVARLVKKMMDSGHSIFAAAKCAMSIQRTGDVPQETNEWWSESLYYWLLCTPTDQAACCLLALQRCRIGEKE